MTNQSGVRSDDELVEQLVRLMETAECMGQLQTVQTIILLEKDEQQGYTHCEETMEMLRDLYRRNASRIIANSN